MSVSSGTNSDPESDGENDSINLEDKLDELREKRASTRETAMKMLIKAMRKEVLFEFTERRKETLMEAVKRGLKKGTSTELKLSSQLFSMMCLTLGVASEDIYKETSVILEETIANSSDNLCRAQAIDTLALSCFVSNTDELATIAVTKLFSDLFSSNSIDPIICTSAVNGYSLLVTTLPKRYVYDNSFPDNIQHLVELLSNENPDLRLAAGFSIALLVEILREIEEDEFKLENLNGYFEVDNVIEILTELSQEKIKQRSKKDKQRQKQPFKDILKTLEEGVSPLETLAFKHQKFNFDSWEKLIQLYAIREALASGLQSHVESNELLQQIFDIEVDKGATKTQLSHVEKRMFYSPNSVYSKARTKDINKQRVTREQVNQVFFEE
jgi:hypothetical protein